jgi:hypothetical protein
MATVLVVPISGAAFIFTGVLSSRYEDGVIYTICGHSFPKEMVTILHGKEISFY